MQFSLSWHDIVRVSRIQLTKRYQREQKPASASRYRADPLDSDFLVNLCLSSCRQPVWRTPYRGFHLQLVATKELHSKTVEHESFVRVIHAHQFQHCTWNFESISLKLCILGFSDPLVRFSEQPFMWQKMLTIVLPVTVSLQEFLIAPAWSFARKM